MHPFHMTAGQTGKGRVSAENMEKTEDTIAFSAMKVTEIVACNQPEGLGWV